MYRLTKRSEKQTKLQEMVLEAIRESPRSRQELVRDLGITPPTMSYILKVLKRRKLVRTITDPDLMDLRKRIYMVIEEPKLDYWMVGILEECAKTEIKRLSSRWSSGYVEKRLEGRNKFDNFGQIQLILDRLNEIRTHYDKEIEDGLDRGMGKTK